MSIDLLVFGPHPDDIEIGLGGTIARHAADGPPRRPVRSDRGELSSNGTPEERQARGGRGRRACSARAWRENLGWPDGGIDDDARADPIGGRLHPPPSAAQRSRCRTGTIAIPITSPPARCCATAAFRSGLRRYETDARAVAARLGLLLLHQRQRAAVVRRRRLGALRAQARGAGLLSQPVRARRRRARCATRLTAPTFRQLIESRDAQFGALAGVAFAEGVVVREPVAALGPAEARAMNIGIVCYASVGGSGVVATELAHALARARPRGPAHQQRAAVPVARRRARACRSSASSVPPYPLFREPQYLLALANTIVRVAERAAARHRARALRRAARDRGVSRRQMLARPRPATRAAPRTVTTLHGTDITLVGSDPSYARVVAFSIEQSHGVTAVSESLKRDTIAALGIRRDDPGHSRTFSTAPSIAAASIRTLRARLCPPDGARRSSCTSRTSGRSSAWTWCSRSSAGSASSVRAGFVLIGDGPVRGRHRAARRRLRADATTSSFVGEQHDLVPWLSVADLFLLPSAQESFGLAALEAMACEVPVVASRVGGLPGDHRGRRHRLLCPPDAVERWPSGASRC